MLSLFSFFLKKEMLVRGSILALLLCSISLHARSLDTYEIVAKDYDGLVQTVSISGTVVDGQNNPLPGASIVEKGTTNGTQADFDGNFTLTVADLNAVLVVSYIGFSGQEVAVNGRSQLQIVLQEDSAQLDEVVVVGYGTARRKDISGAVSTVDLEDSPIALSANTMPCRC